MRKVRRIISVFMALCMICAMSVFASAEEAAISAIPDYGRKGSVTVDIISTDTGKAIPGGKLTLYKVAEADGNNIFRLTEAFKESGVELKKSQSQIRALRNWHPGWKLMSISISWQGKR